MSHVPADVRFHLVVTNNSNIKAEKIAITHGKTAIYTISALEPGASMTLDRDVLRYVMLGLMGVFGAALVLFAISSLVRLNRYRKSKAAYDHLDLAERRDYTEPYDEDDFEEDDAAEDRAADENEEPEGLRPDYKAMTPDKAALLPHEKLLRSAAEDASKAPAQEDMPVVDTQGGYRVTRADTIEAPKPEETAESPEDTDGTSRRHRRASRKVDEE